MTLLVNFLMVCVLCLLFVEGVKALLNEADRRVEENAKTLN